MSDLPNTLSLIDKIAEKYRLKVIKDPSGHNIGYTTIFTELIAIKVSLIDPSALGSVLLDIKKLEALDG